MTTWNLEGMKTHLFICNGSSCMNKDGEEITLAIRDEIQRQALIKKYIRQERAVMDDARMPVW